MSGTHPERDAGSAAMDMNAIKECPICRGPLHPCLSLYDDRYGYPGEFDLMKCVNCGHRALDVGFSEDELERLYTEFYPRSLFSPDDYLPHGEITRFGGWLEGAGSSAFRRVPRNVRVLDIGCGFGETLGYHRARGCDVYGVEADGNIRPVAERFGFKINVGLFSAENYEAGFFDYVTMDQVVEHLSDTISTLKGVSRVLKPGGTAIVSTPNARGWGGKVFGSRWVSWHAPYHLQFFSERSMGMAADIAGFAVEKAETVTDSAYLSLQWNHLRYRSIQGCRSRFWVRDQRFTRIDKMFARGMTLLDLLKVNHAVTRFFDAVGLGDNLVFVLRKR